MTTTLETRPSADSCPASAHDADFSWDILCSRIARVFRLDDAETRRLCDSGTARLIAAIPYAAGCQEAERTAFGHLCLYMAEIRSGHGPGDHTPDDDSSLFSRLRMLTGFKGGDDRIIRHGMNILALVMIQGYYRSSHSDATKNISNPLSNGSWEYDELSDRLKREINAFPCETLDAILPVGNALSWVW